MKNGGEGQDSLLYSLINEGMDNSGYDAVVRHKIGSTLMPSVLAVAPAVANLQIQGTEGFFDHSRSVMSHSLRLIGL